jgi:hypothetical protein
MRSNHHLIVAIVGCLLSLVPYRLQSQVPDWVAGNGLSPRFQPSVYLTGFGASTRRENQGKTEVMQSALTLARKNLVERILVRVTASTESRIEEHGRSLLSSFGSFTQTSSSLELFGLESETYFDEETTSGYGFAWVKKDKMVEAYRERLNDHRSKIREFLAEGKHQSEQSNRSKALEAYLACYPYLQGVEEARAVLLAIGGDSHADKLSPDAQSDNSLAAQVRAGLESAMNKPVASIDDAASYLAYCLSQRTIPAEKVVSVNYFAFQDTRMGSRFSMFFRDVLARKVLEVARWKPIGQVTDQEDSAEFVLSGSYWRQKAGVRILATLLNRKSGQTVGGAEVLIPPNVVKSSGMSLLPANFTAASVDEKRISSNQLPAGGIEVEIRTNKGGDGSVFARGEQMRVYVKVNMPCYIRFVYHQANEERVLLLNSEYVDESKVNKWYPASGVFECDAPFGVEFLQVFARTEPFEPVKTIIRNEREILVEDLGGFLARTRGFKPVSPRAMQAERRLVMTTLENR